MAQVTDIPKKFLTTIFFLTRKKINTQITNRRFVKTRKMFEKDLEVETFEVYSHKSARMFNALCDKYNSDKGSLSLAKASYPWPAHTYGSIYNLIFEHTRHNIRSVLECGIGPITTAFQEEGLRTEGLSSLSIWRDYFPNANIVGVDIDVESLVSSARIQSFKVDQTDFDGVMEFWQRNELPEFDVMIDDGLHSYDAITIFFQASFHKLSENGTYIIEDVHSDDLNKLKKFLSKFELQTQYVLGKRSEKMNNNMIIIRRNVP